jgi:hypothetical protein
MNYDALSWNAEARAFNKMAAGAQQGMEARRERDPWCPHYLPPSPTTTKGAQTAGRALSRCK